MIISTKDFGNVEISEEDVIYFPHGLYAFADYHRFVLLYDKNRNGNNPFMWLHCVEKDGPRFVVIDPLKFFSDYKVLNDEIATAVSLKNKDDLRLLCIATVTKDAKEVYVNLKCPITINARENIAVQAVLDNENYPIRYYLYKKEDKPC
jgi:flagellar assembly factor FliW